MVTQYETSFENKKSSVETVTPMLDKDGKWRVSGYYAGRGRYIDKPTPGCLLIPFALAFIIGGVILLIRKITGG